MRSRLAASCLSIITVIACGGGTETITPVESSTTPGSPTTPGAVSAGSIAWTFCSYSGIPSLVAIQDGTGAWTRVIGANDVYKFDIKSTTGGVAYANLSADGSVSLQAFFGTTSEIIAQGATRCSSPGPGKSVTGTFVNIASSSAVYAFLGSTFGNVNGLNVTFNNVPAGKVDLVASRLPGGAANKFLILRNLDASSGTIPAIDFTGNAAFAPVSSKLSIGNFSALNDGGTEAVTVAGSLVTSNSIREQQIYNASTSNSAPQAYLAIPADKLVAGDVQVLFISAGIPNPPGGNYTRGAFLAFKDAGDKQVSLGPVSSTPVVTAVGSAGASRLRCSISMQPEYSKYFSCAITQGSGPAFRGQQVRQTAAYAAGSQITLEFPDLTKVAGFLSSYYLTTGAAASWSMGAYGFAGTAPAGYPQFTDGLVMLLGGRSGSLTP